MTILEGKSLEMFEVITININVQSQFSKYKITPNKLSFGPMKFTESKEMKFVIDNKGQFPFMITIYDFLDHEMREQLQ